LIRPDFEFEIVAIDERADEAHGALIAVGVTEPPA
jgi:hypothetical protein